MTAVTFAADVLIWLGVLLMAVAALGVLRLPDAYYRANAVTKAAALALVLLLLGVALRMPEPGTVFLAAAAVACQLVTAPVAGYATGRAAYRAGVRRVGPPSRDDLAGADLSREDRDGGDGGDGRDRHDAGR
ncbi:monovalent cation/H(+) antiporter subunit G [Streptomyces aidingensis]|uniref:Multicomponent Na+:H+ antiporter subunit G n=1 Tax=Streptomyces aidingensis TaxID=910347 RepID=A0A1I1FVV3_9ACTN|nr:monovalent cation/H(+) antiporter subunit G [Streptomyces aidingensis]SFC03152.1 multicomponent Na+:H+ antiporter subunit G [Streptomyces aidingensis]